MIGLIFQAWFVIFISLYMYFNDAQPVLVKELSANTVILTLIFLYWQKKKIKDIESFLFIFASLGLILYASITGMIFLPDSIIVRQKLYVRFIFYFSIIGFLFLYKLGLNKKLLIFYTVIASSHLYIYRHHYSSLAILFYLISNLYLLKRFSLSKKNTFDILVFLLLTSSIVSTFISFSYNGTNSVFGFFHLFSGILLYLYFQHLEKDEIFQVVRFNHFFYVLSLFLFCIFILIYLFTFDFKPDFSLNIAGFHVSNIASMIAVNFPSILVITLYAKGKNKFAYILILFISVIVLSYTHSRASTLGIVLSSVFILIYFYRDFIKRNLKIFSILSFFVIGTLIFIFSIYIQRNPQITNSLFARFSIWTAYIERVFNHSILFGFGSNNEFFISFLPIDYLSDNVVSDLQYYYTQLQANPHAHNLYVQFLFNYGMYGFFILIAILTSVFVLLAKKIIQNNLKFIEYTGYSVLISIFFQEIFDYTMLDAMTFFPTIFSLGIISRYSNSFNIFQNKNTLYRVRIKFIYAAQFFLCLFITTLGFNLCLSEKIKILFKNEYTIDNFSNLKFVENIALTEDKLAKFRYLDSIYLPINIDDKKEQFSGHVYFEAFKLYNEKKDLILAEKNFLKCILIFRNSAACYKKLYEIETLKANGDNANFYFQRYKENDPFGLVR